MCCGLWQKIGAWLLPTLAFKAICGTHAYSTSCCWRWSPCQLYWSFLFCAGVFIVHCAKNFYSLSWRMTKSVFLFGDPGPLKAHTSGNHPGSLFRLRNLQKRCGCTLTRQFSTATEALQFDFCWHLCHVLHSVWGKLKTAGNRIAQRECRQQKSEADESFSLHWTMIWLLQNKLEIVFGKTCFIIFTKKKKRKRKRKRHVRKPVWDCTFTVVRDVMLHCQRTHPGCVCVYILKHSWFQDLSKSSSRTSKEAKTNVGLFPFMWIFCWQALCIFRTQHTGFRPCSLEMLHFESQKKC